MRRVFHYLFPLAVLLALPSCLLLPAFLPGHALLPAAMLGRMLPWQGSPAFPHDPPFNPLLFDGIAQFYPWRLFAARTWSSGFVPLWNPYQFCGTPFLANDQSATLYPLNLIFLMMPVARAFAAGALLHLFLTGAFLYAFLRRRLSLWPALLGAVTWQLCGWQVSWLALPTFLCTSAWMPLGLLLVERCAEAPRNIKRALALGCCLGVMLLAGHLQIALYSLVLCAAYGLTLLARQSQPGERGVLALSFALAALIMLFVAAPQLLPTIELARVSHRAGAHATFTGYAGYVSLAMPLYRLATLFSPSFFGRALNYWDRPDIPYSETACFVGVAGLLLACVGAFAAWGNADAHSRRSRFFVAAAAIAMLFALGMPLNLLSYFGIPGFSQSGSPARALCVWSFCVAVLSAYGLESLMRSPGAASRAPFWVWIGLIGAPLAAAVLYVERQGQDSLRLIDRQDLLISFVTAATSVALALRLRRAASIRERVVLASAFTLLAALDLLRSGYGFNSAANLHQVYPTTPAIAFLQQHTASPGGQQRIAVLNASEGVYQQPGVLPPNAATVYKLRDLQGYDSLQTGQYKAYLNALNGSRESSPLENGNMDLTHYEAAISVRAAAETGTGWIVSPVTLGSSVPAISERGRLFVYRHFAPTNGRLWTQTGNGPSAVKVPVVVERDLPTEIDATPQASGRLVIADQYFPGWQAQQSDGQRLPVQEGPGVFRTIPSVQAGKAVVLSYKPTAFLFGLYLACAALLAAAAAIGNAACGLFGYKRH